MKKILAFFLLVPTLAFGQGWGPTQSTVALIAGGGGTDITNYYKLQTGSMSAPLTWTLPTAYAAANGYVLTSTTAGVLSWAAASAGTVTSVGLSMPSIFSVSGSPVTSSGTLTATLANESQNYVFAGPTSGSGTPTFRALVSGDLPAGTGTVTSITAGTGLTGGTITTTGTISLDLTHANVWTGQQSFGMIQMKQTTPTVLAATTNNYAIETTNSDVYLTSSAAINLTGIAAGSDGQVYFLINNGSFTITLTDQDAASSAGNKFLFYNGNKLLAPNGIIAIIYDGTSSTKGWRCLFAN